MWGLIGPDFPVTSHPSILRKRWASTSDRGAESRPETPQGLSVGMFSITGFRLIKTVKNSGTGRETVV